MSKVVRLFTSKHTRGFAACSLAVVVLIVFSLVAPYLCQHDAEHSHDQHVTLHNWIVTREHRLHGVLKAAAPTILVLTGMTFAQLMGGSAIIENVFSWPGLGAYAA